MTDQPSKRGGARQGAGRKASDGATGLLPHTVAMSPALKLWCQRVGAARIRAILESARLAEKS